MKNVMIYGMVSFALAGILNAAPANLTNESGDTAPALTTGQTSVQLKASTNYTISGNNVIWDYSTQTPPVMKLDLTGTSAANVHSGIQLLSSSAMLTINGALKIQGSTMNWDMSKGGKIIINGAENGQGWWDGVALGGHFGNNVFTMANGAILQVKKNLSAIAGSHTIITMDGKSVLEVEGDLAADGNGVELNKITATDSTITLGGISSKGKWNGSDGANVDISVKGGTFKVLRNIVHIFDWKQGAGDALGDYGNNIVLDGSTNNIGGNITTDGAYGGQNYITVKNGGVLTIGGSVYTDILYHVTSGANVNQLTDDGTRGRLKSFNNIIMEGDGSKLDITGDLRVTSGDVVHVKNAISVTGAGVINIKGNIAVQPKDGSTGRKAIWEGQDLNVVEAPDSTLTVGNNVAVYANGFGLVKALDSGNRINVKNLVIGNDLIARENDQYNTIKINGGKLDIKNEIRAFAKVGNGATGAANYVELISGSEMTVGGLVFADNQVATAKAINRFTADKSNLTFNGDVKSNLGGKNDFFLTGSNLTLNGAINQLGEVRLTASNLTINGANDQVAEMKMDADSVVSYKGNLTIDNSISAGGTFIANGEDINSNLLTINNSTNTTSYVFQVLSNVRDGDVVAKTKNTTLETTESDDGLLNTKLILKQMNGGEGYTLWVANNVTPILSKSAYEPNKEVAASINTLFLVNMNSLNKRMGELRNIPNQHGTWGRIFGGRQNNDFANAKTDFVTVQAGYDYSFNVGKDRNNYIGAALSYGYGTTSFNSRYVGNSSSGIAYNLTNSSLSQHLIEFAIYNSYVQTDGWYNDTIIKFGGLLNSMKSTTLNLDNSNLAVTFSDEVGYRVRLGEKRDWYVDPQAELTIGYVSGGNFTRTNTVSNLSIDYDSTTIVRERIGMSAGYNVVKDSKVDVDVYVGLFGEFDQYVGGKLNTKTMFTTAKGTVDGSAKTDMRGVVNYGLNAKMEKGLSLYADVEHSFGGKLSTVYKINAGVRYSFGDTKLELIKPTDKKVEEKTPVKLKEEVKTEESKVEKKVEKETKEVKQDKKQDTKAKAKVTKKDTKVKAKSTKK